MIHAQWITSYIPTTQNCSFARQLRNMCTARQATKHEAKNIRHA